MATGNSTATDQGNINENSDEIVELANRVSFVLNELEEKIEGVDDENYLDRRAVCLALVKGIMEIPDQIISLVKADELEAMFARREESLAAQAAAEAAT